MTDADARRDAVATWFLEFSILWAVFPMLDRLVEERPLDVWMIVLSAGISLTALVVGVMLKTDRVADETRPRGSADRTY